jgi:tRNA G18 (ribose-2'-O)-methylase SpoU
MVVVDIDDPDDERIADYRQIRERDLVGRGNLFIAEGVTVLSVLLRSPWHQTISLLIAEQRLEGLAPMLAALPESVPVYSVRGAVLNRITGYPIHRGILALGRRGTMPAPAALLTQAPSPATIVVLSGTANHDNLGGVFRNAAAFGAGAVLLDRQCCDPLYRKAIRVSVGATLLVPWARVRSAEEAVMLLESHGFAAVAFSPSGPTALAGWARPARLGAFFGPEGPGLPEALLQRLDTLSIPMANGFDSLNLATASGIVLHHLTHVAAAC